MSTTAALDELILISHFLGLNPLYVQAGGGNTSVKCGDGTMVIKASGTPMSDMTREKGWVRVDIKGACEILDDENAFKLPQSEREIRALECLQKSVIEPKTCRPSVETPLHALLGRVVMHSHPVAANALTCHPQGESILRTIEGSSDLPALWVPYTDPGSNLAFTLNAVMKKYAAEHGRRPDVLFLENHGFFCTAETVLDCIELHCRWMNRVEAYFRQGAETVDAALDQRVKSAIAAALSMNPKPPVIRQSHDVAVSEALGKGYTQLLGEALTPDHVVYSGPRSLVMSSNASSEAISSAVKDFAARYKRPPNLLSIDNRIWIIAESAQKVDAAEAMLVSAAQIMLLSRGKTKTLAPKDVDFILNWEVEHFRAKQV